MKIVTINEQDNTVSIGGKTFKIGEEITKPTAAEKRFLELVKGSIRVFDFEIYPDTACFWKKDGEVIIEENKNGYVWIDYDKIWKVFYHEYDYNYDQVSKLCKKVLEKHFNLRGCTAIMPFLRSLPKLANVVGQSEQLVSFLRKYQKTCEIMHVRKLDPKNFVEQYKSSHDE